MRDPLKMSRPSNAASRRGDFLFDLARLRALYAQLLKTIGDEFESEQYLALMDECLLRIDQDQDMPNPLRQRLLDGLLLYPEFTAVLNRPRIAVLVSYARQRSGSSK